MINVNNIEESQDIILEELYMADIPVIKVDNRIVGQLGNWTFERRSTYWSATVENLKDGIPLDVALKLHNKKYPTTDYRLGSFIRSGGHGGAPSPDVFGGTIVFDEKLANQMKVLKYEYGDLSFADILSLEKEGKINIERYVNCYHIDSQLALIEFSKFLKNYINKNVFIDLINERIEYYSGGEEMKSLNESFSDSKVVNELKKFKETIKDKLC